MTDTTQHTTLVDAALSALAEHGAQFVLCHEKRAIQRAWQERWPSLDDVGGWFGGLNLDLSATKRRLGIVPHSIGCAVLDVDHGNADQLIENSPPLANVPTPRGRHLWYEADAPRGNAKWATSGCAGDLRSARGYVLLHDPAAVAEAVDLRLQHPGAHQLPLPWPEAGEPEREGVTPPHPPDELVRETPPHGRHGAVLWTPAAEGFRNVTLHRTLLRAAGSGARSDDDLRTLAQEVNATFTPPLEAREVMATAASVLRRRAAGWPPSSRPQRFRERQALRGRLSGESRRSRTAERDEAIRAAARDGHSLREIAALLTVSKDTAARALRKEEA